MGTTIVGLNLRYEKIYAKSSLSRNKARALDDRTGQLLKRPS